jgi:glycosyltransferase involved in cell wall biosynthesis
MRCLEVVGPFRGASGYDRHTREFVREFVRAGLRVQLTPLAGWSPDMPADMRERWFDDLSHPVGADSVVHFTMPNQAQPQPGKMNVNYTMFEADRIPADWAARASLHQRIVVPSQSSFDAWAASGVPEQRLRLCPLGVAGDFFGGPASAMPIDDGDGRPARTYRHRFLNVADLRPRKNHLGLLRSWMRATARGDDAILLLKVSASERTLAQFRADVGQVEASLGRRLADAAPVVAIADLLSDEALRSLYHSATHYISLSKGEGWDMAMMEAGVAGLQLIAPNHSGYSSYLREHEALMIPATRVPAVFEGGTVPEDQAFFAGASWWQPNESVAAELIRSVMRGTMPAVRSPRERFRHDYSWAKAARRLIDLLEEPG